MSREITLDDLTDFYRHPTLAALDIHGQHSKPVGDYEGVAITCACACRAGSRSCHGHAMQWTPFTPKKGSGRAPRSVFVSFAIGGVFRGQHLVGANNVRNPRASPGVTHSACRPSATFGDKKMDSFALHKQSVKTALAIVTLAMTGFAGQVSAGTCKTVTYFPGVVQVFGTAQGNGTSEDSAFCSTSNACPSGARKVEVFGGGVASKPGAVVAVSSAGSLTSGDEVIASCEAALKQGKKGSAGICHSAETAPADQGVATTADCALFVSAPANGSVAGNASCFCGE